MAARLVDKQQKKQDIAMAAMSVFADRGFESTSMSQVAEEAAIGKGTIYEYFPSKDELIAASVKLWLDRRIEEAEEALVGLPDPDVRLRAFVHSFIELFLADERMSRLIVSIFQLFMTKLHDQRFGDSLRQMFQTGVTSVERILIDGMKSGVFKINDRKEAERIAVNLIAYLDGICLDYLVTGRSFDLKDQVDLYMKYLLEANLK